MAQLALERSSRLTRSGLRTSSAETTAVASGTVLHPLTAMGLAVTLALVTGLVELAMHFVRRQFINPTSMGPLQLNPQAYWMVPVSNVLIFGVCGLFVAAAALVPLAQALHRRNLRALLRFGIRRAPDLSRPDRTRLYNVRRRARLSALGPRPGPAGSRRSPRAPRLARCSWRSSPSRLASVPAAKS